MKPASSLILRLVLFSIFALGMNLVTRAQGPAHVNSICGNGSSYSVSKIRHKDGSYSLSESYMNGQTGERWSKMYTSWDRQWTYYGDHPDARSSRKRSRPPAQTVQAPLQAVQDIVQTVHDIEQKRVVIKNPFFKAKQ